MNAALQDLLRRPDIWRGTGGGPAATITTGFSLLDRHLPGGGWPAHALTELLSDRGAGELRLLMPAFTRLSRRGWRGRRQLAWIAPPHIPYAPALLAHGLDLTQLLVIQPRREADIAWAFEQTLRSGVFAAVMAWLPTIHPSGLRRLQLAAETGACWGIAQRPDRVADQASPAALRLRLDLHSRGLKLHFLKCRGRPGVSGDLLLPHGETDSAHQRAGLTPQQPYAAQAC